MAHIRSVPLTREHADAVFDILVEHCGAREDMREGFVFHQSNEFCPEYRFIGNLGFGGKFWRNHSFRPDGTLGEHWYVANYSEDDTPATAAARAGANPLLNDLRAEHETATPLIGEER